MSVAETTAATMDYEAQDGQKYVLSPLRRRDLGHLIQWVRGQVVAIGRSNSTAELSESDKVAIMDQAWDRAMAIDLESAAFQSFIKTPDGVQRVVWQSLRREHPKLTEAELDGMSMEDLASMADIVMRLTTPPSARKEDQADAETKSEPAQV